VTLATDATMPAYELDDERDLSAVWRGRARQPRGRRGRAGCAARSRGARRWPAARRGRSAGPDAAVPGRVIDGLRSMW